MWRAVLVGVSLLLLGCHVPVDDEPPPEEPAPQAAPEAPLPAGLAPAATLTPFERTVGERMRAVAEVMVEVEEVSGDQVVRHGSGVVVSPRGDVLTAAHVVEDASLRYRVVLPNRQRLDAQVTHRDEHRDVALLRTAPREAMAFARPRLRALGPGDWVVCAGFGGYVPGDRAAMRTAGVVVEPSYTWVLTEYKDGRFPVPKKTTLFPGMIRLDCETAPGMSGGPIVDLDGDLVGVVVGSHGVATPVDAVRHLLPKASPETPALESADLAPPPARGSDGRPSREATLGRVIGPPGSTGAVERSLVTLEVTEHWSRHRFTAVLVSADGLAVAPSVRIVSGADPEKPLAVEDIAVLGRPGARCTEVVAVRGELALLRLSGLAPPASEGSAEGAGEPQPVGPPGGATVGSIIAAVDAASGARSIGFVTDVDRHPGTVAPDGPRWGCGAVRAHFRASQPAVAVDAAIAHDAGWPGFGSLLVDREDRPVAFEVAVRARGLGFAIPWPEVLARFAPWLGPR